MSSSLWKNLSLNLYLDQIIYPFWGFTKQNNNNKKLELCGIIMIFTYNNLYQEYGMDLLYK